MSNLEYLTGKNGKKSLFLVNRLPIVFIAIALAAAFLIPKYINELNASMPYIIQIAFPFVSYFLGGIPFGYLSGKLLKGIDIREHGSKNVGATNVLRVVGKGPGIAVYILDACKGLLPVLLAKRLFPGSAFTVEWFYIAVALAAILGHIFTPYLRFKGGKGVATASGAMLALAPLPLLIALLAFILVFVLTRYVSLGSITAALVFPIAVALDKILRDQDPLVPVLGVAWLLFILVIVTHKANIVRLVEGTENRISFGTRTGDDKGSRNA